MTAGETIMTGPQNITLSAIEDTRAALGDLIVETPVHPWRGEEIAAAAGADTEVFLKLELFQYTGTFKPRGAFNVMRHLSQDALQRGVTAISAGNHAVAVAYCAMKRGVPAKVVMVKTANPFRVAKARGYGAEVIMANDAKAGFDMVHRFEEEEGLTFIHPFEGINTSLGTATLGLELARQAPQLDAAIVPIGGGGLASGFATALKLAQPRCAVYGVEPEGAPTLTRALAAGEPVMLDGMATIADSLAAPFTGATTFSLCRAHLDEVVLVDDAALRRAQALAFREMKLALEPAGAAATAALTGPLKDRLQGKRVGVLVCGSNIDIATFATQVSEAG